MSEDLVDNNCLKNEQLTPLCSLSLVQLIELWVVPDDNSAQKQGIGDQASIWSVHNNSLNNQQLTPL